mgnify:CR=1 FL=1
MVQPALDRALTGHDFLRQIYGLSTTSFQNPEISEVGTSVLQLLRRGPNRLSWTLINLSANTMYVAWSPDPSSSKGIVVSATGGALTLNIRDDYSLVMSPVWIVSSSSSSALFVIETRTYGT